MAHDTNRNILQIVIGSIFGIIGRGLLIIIFFCVFTPFGFIMRLLGGDPLRRQLESKADSYYQPSKERSGEHMDKPF